MIFMEIASEKEKGWVVVSVTGRIDAVTAPEFEKALAEQVARGEKNFLLNFIGLDYISSAGLRSILATAQKLKPGGGKMIFSGLRGTVRDIFQISGFATMFKILDTREDALK